MERGTGITVVVALVACSGDVEEHPGPPVGAPVDLAAGGVVECASPSARSLDGPFDRRTMVVPRPDPRWTWATGITAGDLDGDGLLDLLAPVQQGLEMYRTTSADSFEPVGMALFGAFDLSYASGTTVADYDGDGDLDVYVMRVVGDPAPEGGTYGENRLLRNDGGVFVDVTAEAGVAACGPHHRTGVVSCFRTMVSSWGDYDQDGDLDLYVGNYGWVDETIGTTQERFEPAEPDFLYRNEGDGTFADVSDELPLELHDGYSYAGGFFDLDGDLDLDLFTVNDFATNYNNRVLWNEAGTLVFDPAEASGLVRDNMTGMGLGIADFNGDGWLDLAVTEWGKNSLLESWAEQGLWIDRASERGFVIDDARDQRVGWGTETGDVDNDGDVDIVNQYGHLDSPNPVWENPTTQPDAVYLNTPAGDDYVFTDVGQEWRVNDPSQTRGAVLADLDRDGWLDIAKRSLNDDNVLYLSDCGTEAWLEVRLRQPGTMNTHAVGARIAVEAGDLRASRWIVAGGTGFASSPAPEAHFGLGEAETIDRLTVVWPDGEESWLYDVTPRQVLTITRSE